MRSVRSRLVIAPCASDRLAEARRWLDDRPADAEVLMLAASAEAASELLRARVAAAEGFQAALFGVHRMTLGRFAATLALTGLAAAGRTPASGLSLEALCARIVHRLSEAGRLGRFAAVAGKPGLPRALADTILELRMAETPPDALAGAAGDLARLVEAYEAELASAGLADRATVLRAARDAIDGGEHPLVGLPVLLLDVPVRTALERSLIAAIAGRSEDVLAVGPAGDERGAGNLSRALGVLAEVLEPEPRRLRTSLGRVQARLFDERELQRAALGHDVAVLSAPGESRECVEIARRIREEAARGVPFDRMAVLLRQPGAYRAHLAEALRRADVPAFFAPGTLQPDPAGRALLALLGCAAEDLSARRFAEYLSLGEVPDASVDGAPPPPREDRFVASEEELVSDALGRLGFDGAPAAEEPTFPDGTDEPVVAGQLRTPRRWEKLLGEAAVIGGRERWVRRLDGLEYQLELEARELDDDDPAALRIARDLRDLRGLRAFALPLLDALAALPSEATWGEWIDVLGALATRAIRHPERVLALLQSLAPMGPVGPISLDEVRLVLGRRLTELLFRPKDKRYGKVFVADVEAARGLSFGVVFVPGLVERRFPRKVTEDPILLDRMRERVGGELAMDRDRVATERLLLRLAVGAAEERLILSWPRVDTEQSRPRVPSFYGLEVLRAAEGRLPGFSELAKRADKGRARRLAWPAPDEAEQAVDAAEYDLAVLDKLLRARADEASGLARYLLEVNPHLARALRFRARRYLRDTWTPADGLVLPGEAARAVLAEHGLAKRSYSPTALQNFAQCPYKFLLYTVHRLSPREEPEAVEVMPALERGSLFHEVQFRVLSELREEGLLPIAEEGEPETTAARLEESRERLDRLVDEVAGEFRDKLAPAIPRVWEDGVAQLRADLHEWLRRKVDDPAERRWVPHRFELAFGLRLETRDAADPASTPDAVPLDCGIQLRGSIDLVERRADGALRATDHKTGRPVRQAYVVVGGGRVLQPVLYALALEKLEPGVRVEEGRLYYCTDRGGFSDRVVLLDPRSRAAADLVARAIGEAIDDGFLPALPYVEHGGRRTGCDWCDFRPVCGPDEVRRVARKRHGDPRLKALWDLRAMS